MYKNYRIEIIKNDVHIPHTSDSESDTEYIYDDELQIISESGDILFNLELCAFKMRTALKGYEFKSYELIDNYLIIDIDEGHKFTLNNGYRIDYDKSDKKILFEFEETKYNVKYFFENQDKIIEEYELERHKFNTTTDTLLKGYLTILERRLIIIVR